MPKRKRPKSPVVVLSPEEAAVAEFAKRKQDQETARREAKAAAKAAREHAARHEALQQAKDAAAEKLKSARRNGAVGERLAAADAAYRDALTVLMAFERGDPEPAPQDGSGPESEVGAEPEPESGDPSEADAAE